VLPLVDQYRRGEPVEAPLVVVHQAQLAGIVQGHLAGNAAACGRGLAYRLRPLDPDRLQPGQQPVKLSINDGR
jgi:hypothetical protein